MTVDIRYLSHTSTDLSSAGRIWAAACSTAGALAPDHIADVLTEQWEAFRSGRVGPPPDLSVAAIEGTRRASEEHESHAHLRRDGSLDHVGPEPRGVDLRIYGGRTAALVWDTGGSHVISLRPVGSPSRPAWVVEIQAPSDAISTSPRIAAMLGMAWRLVDSDAQRDQILDLARRPLSEEGLGQTGYAWLEKMAVEQARRIAHRFQPVDIEVGESVTMTIDYEDGEGERIYRGTVRRVALEGRRVLVDWEDGIRPRRTWYVDVADLQRSQGAEATRS